MTFLMHRILTQRQVQSILSIEIEMNALRIIAQVLACFLKEEMDLKRHRKIMNKHSNIIEDVLLKTRA